jgi:hypothetical protein
MIAVSSRKWPYRHRIPKDPNATLDYQLDWADWLTGDETIVTLDVEVTGLELEETDFTATTTTAWVSGGEVGVQCAIRFRITTDSVPVQRIEDRTLLLSIKER